MALCLIGCAPDTSDVTDTDGIGKGDKPGSGSGSGSGSAAPFVNLDFESVTFVAADPAYGIDPTFGFLSWSKAVPGWEHSQGSDTGVVYHRNVHLGSSQWYLLVDSDTPGIKPLAGKYSLAFSSGRQSSIDPSSPFVQAFIAQKGFIAKTARSLRLLVTGAFSVELGGTPLQLKALGGDEYVADITAWAGKTAQLKISTQAGANPFFPYQTVVVDDIRFSSAAL